MSICAIDADNCLTETVNRTSTNVNKVGLIQGNLKHKASWQKDLCHSAELHEKMVSWPRFQGHKTMFSCNMHIF